MPQRPMMSEGPMLGRTAAGAGGGGGLEENQPPVPPMPEVSQPASARPARMVSAHSAPVRKAGMESLLKLNGYFADAARQAQGGTQRLRGPGAPWQCRAALTRRAAGSISERALALSRLSAN